MLSRVVLAALVAFAIPRALAAQALVVLHIKVVVVDAERKAVPMSRHALLISDLPPSAAPRLVVTAADGTADVKLRPGKYSVESDRPVAFQGKAYQWTRIVEVAAGRDTVLELTADNAEVSSAASTDATALEPVEADPSAALSQWQDSVVAVWTPTTRASGFVVDARGLVATNQRGIGNAAAVEVQLTPAVKVAATVLATDPSRDVAVLWIDPKAIASLRPVSLGCERAGTLQVADRQPLFTIGISLRQQKDVTSGTATRVDAHSIVSDFDLAHGSAGGPVFIADGGVVGITSSPDEKSDRRRGSATITRAADACAVLADAEKKLTTSAPPNGMPLPVEPVWPFAADAVKDAVQRRSGNLAPYPVSSASFDVVLITPLLTYGAQHQSTPSSRRPRNGGRPVAVQQEVVRPLVDFGDWSDYVAEFPPVVLVRVTPKLVEGFWTTVARGAAQTQGVKVPPIKHVKSPFLRMRVYCGDDEVTPIHPFVLEHRLPQAQTVREGLYAFDPDAFGPQCGTVNLVLYSDKEPNKGETSIVDPVVAQQVWQDFAPYRSQDR